MSIENQLERLNINIEALVGAIAANTSVTSAILNSAAQAPASAPKITANKRGGKATQPAEPEAETPVAESAPAPVAEAPQAAADPFGDAPAPAPASQSFTLDDVREYGLKLRDAKGVEAAKKLIESFGVAKLADIPADKYAAFVRKCIALTSEETEL